MEDGPIMTIVNKVFDWFWGLFFTSPEEEDRRNRYHTPPKDGEGYQPSFLVPLFGIILFIVLIAFVSLILIFISGWLQHL